MLLRSCRTGVCLLLIILMVQAQAWAARTKLEPGFNMFSKEQEVQLGREAMQQVEREVRVTRDSALNNYVMQLGQRLARYSTAPEYPYTFKVIQDKRINAFALPGGPIYIHTGTIAAAENEAQLAGVIGHEIAHVALRHATNNASKAMLAQAPLAILGGIIGSGSILGQLAQLGIGFGAQSLFLKYSRDAERQADILGTQMLYDAGYQPQEMAEFFRKLEEQEKSRSVEFLSSHPNPGNRRELVQREVQALGPQKNLFETQGNFAQVRSRALSLNQQPAADPQLAQGQQPQVGRGAERPPMPSGDFRTFNAGDFSMSHPDNWNVYGQGTSALTVAPREGLVQSGDQVGIAYGAIISIFEPEVEENRVSARAATTQLVEQLHRSNQALRVISRQQRFQIEGHDAVSVTMRNRSPVAGEDEIDWLVTVQRPDGSLWYAVFVSPERDFSSLRPIFEQMLQSVRFQW